MIIMEFNLKKPIQIHDKEQGAYKDVSKIVVSFIGKKGLKALKSMQDIIFKSFMETANKDGAKKQEEKDKKSDITMDDMLIMVEMTGNSERVLDSVMDSLKTFGSIEQKRLNDQLLNEMDIQDLEGLYEEVLKSFLLPKIIQQMNSMTK